MHLYIAVCSNREHKPQLTDPLIRLVEHILTGRLKIPGLEGYELHIIQGLAPISRPRQKAMAEARKAGATHLVYIDDDMTFPPKALEIMLSRNVDAIGANYAHRIEGHPGVCAKDFEGKMVKSYGKTGIEEVHCIGFGLFIIRLAAFEHIAPPHFEVLWDYKIQDYIPEDVYFCMKARKNGVKVYADHDASQPVGHIGDIVNKLAPGL